MHADLIENVEVSLPRRVQSNTGLFEEVAERQIKARNGKYCTINSMKLRK
jgi:hypothetical protein